MDSRLQPLSLGQKLALGTEAMASYLGVVGGRRRFRMSTPPSADRPPLRGFFVLDWHDRPDWVATEETTDRILEVTEALCR